MKKVIVYLVITIACLLLLFLIVGLCLPKQRIHSHENVYDAPPKEVFSIVTDNEHWQHRRDLKDLKIISTEGDKQVWDEFTKDGQVIRFETKEYKPYSFYSFTMKSNVMKGYWTSEYKETGQGKTHYIATEYLTISNPFLRVLNRIFFDIEKYMARQQEDIQTRLNELRQHE